MDIVLLKDKFRTSKWRIYLARVIAVIFIFLIDIRPSFIGFLIIFSGILIRVWASGYLKKRKKLAVSGPYRFTRNPLYLGTILIGVGFWVMSDSFFILLPFFAVFAGLYARTIRVEEKELLEKFGKEYEMYIKSVPRFIPNFKNLKGPKIDKFSFENFLNNKEYLVIIGIVGAISAIIILRKAVYPFIFN